jgi:pyruvate,water dikinase
MGLPANFFEVMARDEKAERRHRPPLNARALRTYLRMARFAFQHIRMRDEISAFIERHGCELEPYRRADWSQEPPDRLLASAERLAALYSENMWYNFVGPLNMMGRNRMMNRLVERHAPDVHPADLLRGLMGLKSLESHRALQALAADAGQLGGDMPEFLMEGDEAAIRARLAGSATGRTLLHEVDAFLDRYGFLSACGTDLSRTPWCEEPTLIWRAIGRMARNPSQGIADDVLQVRDAARARVRARLNPVQQRLFDRLLQSTVAYVDLREKSSSLISEDSFQLRRVYAALADRLVADGVLEQRDDVFYLTHEELKALVDGDMEAEGARARVARERMQMTIDAQVDPPDTLYGDHVPVAQRVLPEDQPYLCGICGSSGYVEGYARVVLDPAAVRSALTPQDILVVPFTDMSWTPLFSGIGGIIAETGGQLSHSAIVAREYGLPAVVNVKRATRLIKDGCRVAVDGTNGRIYLKENTQ